MHIIHSHNHKRADEFSSKPAAFFITNKKGGYLSLGEKAFSHMQGLFFFDNDAFFPFKVLENIIVAGKMVALRNSFATVERVYDGECEEAFTMINNAMFYSIQKYTGEIVLDLDFRHIFDYSDQGRIYSISQEEDELIIKFDKFADGSCSGAPATYYLVVKGVKAYRMVDEWEKKNYSYDEKRGAKSEFYTYKAVAIPVHEKLNLVFSYSKSLELARQQAKVIFENEGHYLSSMRSYMSHAFNTQDIAMDCAMKALDDLLVTVDVSSATKGAAEKRTGVFAGLPWFFQFWSRDELISLRALMLHKQFAVVKDILMNYVAAVGEDGLVPNRLPDSPINSLDASGWLFVRIHDFLSDLVHHKVVDRYLSEQEILQMRSALERAIQGVTHHHAKDGFVFGKLQESWMDTPEAKRSGCFIESQAFVLAMMRLHNELALATKGKQLFIHAESEFAQKVKQAFYKDGKLLDTVDGELPGELSRPNLFLAYYIYPGLLSRDEWKSAFDNALKDLWLDWGGLATISHTTPYFQVEYTGEKDTSYHCGDSWFWVNNLAAIAMHRLDKVGYKKYIDRILHASKEELLFSGFVGCSAELSSAKDLRSEGCLSQAWSNATLVELLHELGHHSKSS